MKYDLEFDVSPIRKLVADQVAGLVPSDSLRVLDAGTGTGRTARLLVASGPAERVVFATDISNEMLRVARSASGSNVSIVWMRADHGHLPFAPATLDVVVSTFTLHHVPPSEQMKVLREFRRVLRPGGVLLLADQVQTKPPLPPKQMRQLIATTFYPHVDMEEGLARLAPFGEWPRDVEEMTTMFSQAGFGSNIRRVHRIVAIAHCRTR